MKIIITIYTIFALNLTYTYSQSQILERGQSVLNVNVPLVFGTSDNTGIVYAGGLGYSAKGIVDFGFFVGKYSAYNQRQIRSKGTVWGAGLNWHISKEFEETFGLALNASYERVTYAIHPNLYFLGGSVHKTLVGTSDNRKFQLTLVVDSLKQNKTSVRQSISILGLGIIFILLRPSIL